MRSLLVAAVLLVIGTVAPAQVPQGPPPPPGPPMPPRALGPAKAGTCVLAGQVVSAETGKPLRRALIRASSNELREGRSVSTDANGAWQLKDLPAGKYSITVQKGGFVQLSYGQRRPFEQGKPVDVAEGQRVENLDVALPKGGVVTGRIVDEFGEPMAGARVAAMRHRFTNGQRRLIAVPGMGATDTTDDIGQYRLHGLSPGEYYVSASTSASLTGFNLEVSGDRTGYAGTYYPGTVAVTEAQRVSVAVGQEASEINFPLIATRVAKVSGIALNSSGRPVSMSAVMMTTTGGTMGIGGSPLAGMAMTGPDGSFTLSNVEPGEYRLEMLSASDLERVGQTGTTLGMSISEAASLAVTVSGQDVTGLTLMSAPTATASGRVVFEGEAPPESTTSGILVFALTGTPTSLPFGGNARTLADGTFELKGLTGKRLFRLNPPKDWYLKSVTVNGTDVIDTPLEIKPSEPLTGVEFILTRAVATLGGTVQDARGKKVEDYVVVLFSSDPLKWGYQTRFVRSARPDQTGAFSTKGMPADDYLAVALEYLEPGEEQDPELLERLKAAATPVRISEGDAKTMVLKLARQPGT